MQQTKTWQRWFWALAAAWALAACGSGGGEEAPAPQPPVQPAGSALVGGAAQTAEVTIDGAGGAKVLVPAGAASAPVTVRVAADSAGMPALPRDLPAAGPVVAVTPHGARFDQNVVVSVPAPAVALAANERLRLAKADPGGSWTVLGDTEMKDGRLSAEVRSFSYFMPVVVTYIFPFGAPVPPPPLKVTGLTMDCAPSDCRELPLQDSDVRVTVTTNQGVAPSYCVPSTVSVVLTSRSIGPASSYVEHSLPVGGGTVVHTLSPVGISEVQFEPVLRCQAVDGSTRQESYRQVLNAGFAARRYLESAFQTDLVIRAQAPQVGPLVVGSPGRAEAVISGGALDSNYPLGRGIVFYARPTYGNRAIVNWERSDDAGTSWRTVAQSFQDEAEQVPWPGMEDNYVAIWRVRHDFMAENTPSGQLMFRVKACVDVRVAVGAETRTENRCFTSPAGRAQVLQQASAISFGTLPRSLLVLAGQTASLSALATASPAPTLQWQTRPANSTGAWADVATGSGGTSANYTTPVLSLADNGVQFRVVARNAGGSAESPPITVSVSSAPVAPQITADLADLNALRGGNAVFAVAVRGTEPLNYAWRLNGQPVNGQNAAVLSLPGSQADAVVSVTVSNSAGSVSSRDATLSLFDSGPPPLALGFVRELAPSTATVGDTVALAVHAQGSGVLHYQWFKDGNPIAGAPDAPLLTLDPVRDTDAGRYKVQLSSSLGGQVMGREAVLTVRAAGAAPTRPAIDLQPTGLSVNPGQDAVLAVAASGSGPLVYQWEREGVPVAGATQAVLRLVGVGAAEAGSYTVTVSNSAGSVISQPATVLLLPAPGLPVFTLQQFTVRTIVGATPRIAVAVSATPAARCLWLRNGVLILGATDCTGYTTPPLNLSDSGAAYTTIAYNEAGAVVAGPAVLDVQQPAAPAITQQPVDVSVVEGGFADLLALASGSPTPDPQWFVDGQRIPFGTGITFTSGACTVAYDQTQSRLRLFSVPLACNGKVFSFTAVNTLGIATSNPVTLTVTPAVPAGGLTATQVVAGYEWSLVLRPDRTVWGWGGLHTVNGTVVVSNMNPADQARRPVQMYPTTLTDVRQIAGWYDGFWALTGEPGSVNSRALHWGNARSANDGRGSDGLGNPGSAPQNRINATPVPMLERRVVGGSLQSVPVDRVCSIAATSDRTLLIRALDDAGNATSCAPGVAKTVWVAGTLTPFGANSVGLVVPVAGLPVSGTAGYSPPARVHAQQPSSASSSGPALVLLEDGRAFAWGDNFGNRFGLPAPAATGTQGNASAPLALRAAWGTALDAAVTYNGLFVLRNDGTVMASGRNENFELGLGNQAAGTQNDGPLAVLASAGAALGGVSQIVSTDTQVSLALRGGQILAWGAANHPLKGSDTTAMPFPTLLPASGSGWRSLSAAHGHALAIAASGAVYTWGSGLRGALGNGIDGGAALAPNLVTVP